MEKKETCHYKHFSHRDCEYFPCHNGADKETFNCLFCYCPLFALGSDCGGNFRYLENGIKDCSGCLVPHSPGGYDHVMAKIPALFAKVQKEHQTSMEETSNK